MKLKKILSDISNQLSREENLIYLERYVNDVKGNFSDFSDVDIRYSPENGAEQFAAAYKYMDISGIYVVQDEPDLNLINEIMAIRDFVKFIWHPDMPSPFIGQPDGYYSMSPTSSTRTILTRGLLYNFMVKTDLDKRHFRFRRRLKGSSVKHSVSISRDIADAVKIGSVPFYGYLPESLGFIYGDISRGIGVIFREITPRPIVSDLRQLIPYFSLYSRDVFAPNDIPLLIELIELNSSNDPLGFFVSYIVGFVQDAWVWFVRERGILPELHGQNALIEIDAYGFPRRLIHRDFQSIYSDSRIRESKGLPQFEKHIIGIEDGITYPQQYSIVFDHEISRYLLERMVRIFVLYYSNYSFDYVARVITSRFRDVAGDIIDMFPQTTYRFSKQSMIGNSVTIVDTKEKPIFR